GARGRWAAGARTLTLATRRPTLLRRHHVPRGSGCLYPPQDVSAKIRRGHIEFVLPYVEPHSLLLGKPTQLGAFLQLAIGLARRSRSCRNWQVLGDACGLEQRLRGFEVRCGEPLGEAGVDRGQEVTRRRGPSLVMP